MYCVCLQPQYVEEVCVVCGLFAEDKYNDDYGDPDWADFDEEEEDDYEPEEDDGYVIHIPVV